MPIPRNLLAMLAAPLLLLAACGDDDTGAATSGDPAPTTEAPSDGESESGTFPVTVTYADAETTIDARPEAIVSLSPTATEMLFAIGAGEQVAAVDDQSDYPPDAPTSDLSSYEPNVEAIVAEGPDLVVLSGDANDVVAGLETAGVTTLVLPAAETIDDTYAQIEVLGTATGHETEADEVVGEMKTEVEELTAEVPERDAPLTYYHELDDTLFSVTSETFIGEIYSLAGLENVADAADPTGESAGYPQLSAEYLIDADPDVVFLADTVCCNQTPETFGARPGFAQLTAVQEGNVVALDDDIASRWGPRVVDFLRAVVEATADLEAAATG